MRLKKGFSLKKIHEKFIVVCDEPKNCALTSSIELSETSVFLWKLLEKGDVTKEEMLNAILSSFDISTVLALNNIDVFVKTLIKHGIIEE